MYVNKIITLHVQIVLFYTIRYRIYTYDIEINQYLLIEKGLERHAQNIARRTDSNIIALSLIHIMARLFD